MAQSMVVISNRVEILDKHKYDTWRIQMQAILIKNNAWPYVSGETPEPALIPNDAVSSAIKASWKVADQKAKSDIILTMSPMQLNHLRNCETSKQVWDKLESVYASQGPARKATSLEQLLSRKLQEGDDVRDHLSTYMGIVAKLKTMEVDINGELLSVILVQSLRASFDNFQCAIKSRDKLPGAEKLIVKIIDKSESRKKHSSAAESGAMFARKLHQNGPSNPKNDNNQNTSGEQRQSRWTTKCNYCQKKSHKTEHCYKRKREMQNTNHIDESFMADAGTSESFNVTSDKANQKWCMDSGATSHLCNNLPLFTTSRKVNSEIRLASKAITPVTAKGEV